MAFYTLILVVIALSALVLWQRLSHKKKIPKGLKELPGPKGTSTPSHCLNTSGTVFQVRVANTVS